MRRFPVGLILALSVASGEFAAKPPLAGIASISVESGPDRRISRQALVEIEDAVFQELDRQHCFSTVVTAIDGASTVDSPVFAFTIVVSLVEETLEHGVGLAQSVDRQAPPGAEPPRRATARIEGDVFCVSGTDDTKLGSKHFEVSATEVSQPGFAGDPVGGALAAAASRAAGRIVAFACSSKLRKAALASR